MRYGRRGAGGKVSAEGTSSGIGTCQFQAPLMRLGDPTRNSQAKSRAAAVVLGARARFIGAEESLEDARPQLGRNAAPGVCNVYRVFSAVALARHGDAPKIRRVLDGVIQ